MLNNIKFLVIAVLYFSFQTPFAEAQEEQEATETVAVTVPITVEDKGPEDALGRGTPRGSIIGYLQATSEFNFEKAAEYLDLRNLPEEVSEIGGHPTVTKSRVSDLDGDGRTDMQFRYIAYDLGLPDEVFTERSLRRPPREWLKRPPQD